MIFRMRLLGAVVLLVCIHQTFAQQAFAQSAEKDAEPDALCAAYRDVPLPADALSVPEPKSFPTCDAYKSYAGIGRRVDFAAARKCAWSERLAVDAELLPNPASPLSWDIGGRAILSEIYANGEGVEKNLPLAIRLTCENRSLEVNLAIQDLLARRDNRAARHKRFKACDFAYSQSSMNYCWAYRDEISDDRRARALKAISAGWNSDQRDAFNAVMRTEFEYSKEHGRKEIDLGGSSRDFYISDATQYLRDNFIAAVRAFERDRMPAGTADDALKSDTELNRLYRLILAKAQVGREDQSNDAVQPDGLRATQTSWLQYRDAFLAFAALRYPKTSRDCWVALLTSDRIAILKDVNCEVGPDRCLDKETADGPLTTQPLP